jgi:hypothetical protein
MQKQRFLGSKTSLFPMGSKENDIWAKNMLENNRRKLGHASENRSSPNWPFFGPFFETSKKGSNSPVLKHKTSVERGEILWPRKPIFGTWF